MGLWVKANATAVEAISAAVLVLGFIGLWMYHDHRVASAATAICEQKVATPIEIATLKEQLDRKSLEITRLEAQQAEHDSLAAIALHPITRPVWVCNSSPVRHGPAAASADIKNGGASADARPDVDGTRVDVRPGIQAFESRYEWALAEARKALAECSTVQIDPMPPITENFK